VVWSPKVIGNVIIWQSTYDFLFVFNRNCVSILYRFWDTGSYLWKFTNFDLPYLLEGHSLDAGLFRCNLLNICAASDYVSIQSMLVQSLCIRWASCWHIKHDMTIYEEFLHHTYSSAGGLESRFKTSDNHLRRFCCDFLFVRSWTSIIPKQHTQTHLFIGLFSKTTWISRYQKDKPFWILLGWQWHQLDHMQLMLVNCISLQTDNHTSISSLFLPRELCLARY